MIYKMSEYKPVFDTPLKRQQERAVVVQIMRLLNEGKYDSLEEFMNKNPNYQEFLKKNDMENVVKHFGNTLGEVDFKTILESLRRLSKDKKAFSEENIKTTSIGDKEYVSLNNGQQPINLDNSSSGKSIESQMRELQPTQQEFQTSDRAKNTENLFKELSDSKKEGINLFALNQIDRSKLNNEESLYYNVAVNYQFSTGKLVKVDVQKGIIADDNNNLFRIINENGQITIKGENSEEKGNENTKNEEIQKGGRQLVLKASPNSIYSNVA